MNLAVNMIIKIYICIPITSTLKQNIYSTRDGNEVFFGIAINNKYNI